MITFIAAVTGLGIGLWLDNKVKPYVNHLCVRIEKWGSQ